MGIKMSKKKTNVIISDDVVKSDITMSKKEKKKKHDVIGIIHRSCRVIIFRTIEAIMLLLAISIIVLLIGNIFLPMLSFSMASSAGLTQSTDIYTATALWFIPMIFFCLLITAATFCILRKIIKAVHKHFSEVIQKGHQKDMEREGAI